MVKLGVDNLNLHQLRLTKHNAANLIKRNYTLINAEQPIILESELAALEIVNYAKKHHLNIGINYCSFHFKNRFQKSGFRKTVNQTLAMPDEMVSSKGYIQEYSNKSLVYKNIRIFDTKPDTNTFSELKLDHKSYYYIRETLFKRLEMDTDEDKKVNSLLLVEPNAIPTDPLLFNIWQLEYIEKGLREY